MAIDRIEFMTLDTLPPATTPEVQTQFIMLKELALHPGVFRLVFFHLPANIRLHAKYSLINQWQKFYDIQSISIAVFTQELIDAIRKGDNWETTLKQYKEPSILLVDDLQFITGKDSTQEAFYTYVLKPRLEAQKLTILFSEYSYDMLSITLRDDLRNLLKLGFHDPQ